MTREKNVWKQEGVKTRRQMEALSEALQNGAKQVEAIEATQCNQQEVERVAHVFGGQDEAREDVEDDPTDSNGGLNQSFQPKTQPI